MFDENYDIACSTQQMANNKNNAIYLQYTGIVQFCGCKAGRICQAGQLHINR